MSDIAAKSDPTTAAVADSTRSCTKPDKQSRFAEALDDYLATIFQEEDQISENSGEKGVYFRRIPQMHGETVVMNKRAIRQVRTLLALCTEGSLAQFVPDANVSRTVNLLISAVEAAESMGLADMIKCGAALDSKTELSAEFCHRLDLALSISCLGLEAAALVIDMAASGKASNTACTGDSLHTAVLFFKESLTNCVVPLLDLTPKCGLAEVFRDTSSSLNGRLQAFLGTILATHEPVISLVRRPLLAEQDIISLVFASIGITFSSSELLAHGIDTNTLESIRRCSQSLLRQVFEFHVDQRTWMLEEILASLIRLPTKKRAQSSSRIAGGKSVQSITILLLKLLQGTAHLPEDLTAGFEGGALPAKEYRMMHQKHRRAVETATSSSDFTVRYLIGRCIKRDNKASANEAEYRTLLEAFIDDCIVLLGHPQWPAAELVVRIYSLHMLELLDDEKTDIGLKTLALDSAAQVASHIAYEQQALEDAAKAGDRAGLDMVSPGSSLESINRFRDASTSLLEYLQSKAVGGEATNAIPLYIGNWATMLITALLKGKPRTGKPDGSDNQCDDDVDMGEDMGLHLDSDSDFGSDSDSGAVHKGQESTLMLHKGNAESDSNEHGKSGQSAADGLVANFNDAKHRAIQGCLKDYMDITHRSNSVMPNNVTFTSAAKAARSVFLLLPLYRSFDMLLTRVILALSATQVTLRSKALRALNQIASQRASVLYQVNVKYAINHRLQDSSPQVREAAIDLIGKHIAQNPELTDQYYEFVSVRVLDKGPSVRKRVMKILRDIYVSSTDTVQLVDIGVRILQRTGDDERSIRELATKMLHELWFTSVEQVFVEDEDSICGGEAAGNVFNLLSPDSQREMLNRVRVMTGVMEASRSRELSELMAGLFEHVTTKVSTAEADEALLVIRCIIEALFEQLLKSEEAGLGLVVGASFYINPRDGTFDATTSAMFSTAACLRFISALSGIAPDVVGQHAEMLSAYLKMTNAAEEDVLYSVLTIFSNVLLKIPHPSKQFLDSLEADLISLLSSSPQGILAIVVPCLCTLVDKITWNYGKLVRLFRSCALQLYREKQRIVGCTTGNGGLSAKNLMRFIVLAGLT
ncbi:Sister chromatid cohesion protein 2, partial [Kickxella alabastrina]